MVANGKKGLEHSRGLTWPLISSHVALLNHFRFPQLLRLSTEAPHCDGGDPSRAHPEHHSGNQTSDGILRVRAAGLVGFLAGAFYSKSGTL
jgi:hypothetical protein